MKLTEILIAISVFTLVVLFFLYFPFAMFYVSHVWTDADKWDCTYRGGVWVATTTEYEGFTHICQSV